MSSNADEVRIEDRVRQAITDALRGTDYLPDDGGIITDMVLIAGYIDVDSDPGWLLFTAGAPWATRGLIGWAEDRFGYGPVCAEDDE